MKESSLDRVLIDVAGELVEISRHDRDTLLEELSFVAGCKTIREKFEASGEHTPVELDDEQRSRLRAVLDVWEREATPPDGIARLLVALVRADSGGHVG